MGRIFYIMGKSATGKDHVYRDLIRDKELDLRPIVLFTTRPMREKEKNGREYWFVDEQRLAGLREKGQVIEERVYHTVLGDWYYFTADDGQIRPEESDYLGIGTLESLGRMRAHFGKETVVPIYIETEDGLRLERALKRERKQAEPNYAELCRRFLADCEDYSEEKLAAADISVRILNSGTMEECVAAVKNVIRQTVPMAAKKRNLPGK